MLFITALNFIIKSYVLTLFTILILISFLNVCVRFERAVLSSDTSKKKKKSDGKCMNRSTPTLILSLEGPTMNYSNDSKTSYSLVS